MANAKKIAKLIAFVALCELVGAAGSYFTIPSISNWYVWLSKPFFTPPNWAFGPIWVALYALMGISAYLVYERMKRNKGALPALEIFAAQLVLNFTWSFVFFGRQEIFGGLVLIGALWFEILFNIAAFAIVRRRAAYLLIPYIAWVTIALLLNYYILVLN